MWKYGSAQRIPPADPSPPGRTAADWTTFATRFRWVRMAALGRPVVPPVGWSTAASAGRDAASNGCPEASRTTRKRFGVSGVWRTGVQRLVRRGLVGERPPGGRGGGALGPPAERPPGAGRGAGARAPGGRPP